MKTKMQPKIIEEKINQIKIDLENVEWYSPTMPLPWKEYHKTLIDLCDIIEKLLKEKS